MFLCDKEFCRFRSAAIRIRPRRVPRIAFDDDELRLRYALLPRFDAFDSAQAAAGRGDDQCRRFYFADFIRNVEARHPAQITLQRGDRRFALDVIDPVNFSWRV